MTSKEALKHITEDDFNMIITTYPPKPAYNGLTKEDMIAIIEKDLDKLSQLEDIEKELGVDLITLNKLRKADKIYVKFFDDIQEWNKTRIELRNCNIWYGYYTGKGYGLSQSLSNYGTGFALTKEELEKCQK